MTRQTLSPNFTPTVPPVKNIVFLRKKKVGQYWIHTVSE